MEYRIGDLAATVGLPVHVVRFYEKYGIVSPKRTGEGNYRTFEELDLRRLTLARHLRSFGFSLEQTAELLSSSTYAQQYEALDLRAHQITQELRRLERVRQSIYRELSDMDFAQETLTQSRLTRLPGKNWRRRPHRPGHGLRPLPPLPPSDPAGGASLPGPLFLPVGRGL